MCDFVTWIRILSIFWRGLLIIWCGHYLVRKISVFLRKQIQRWDVLLKFLVSAFAKNPTRPSLQRRKMLGAEPSARGASKWSKPPLQCCAAWCWSQGNPEAAEEIGFSKIKKFWRISNMRVSWNWGTPIAGWFLLGKIPSRNGWFGGTPILGNHHINNLDVCGFCKTNNLGWAGRRWFEELTAWKK